MRQQFRDAGQGAGVRGVRGAAVQQVEARVRGAGAVVAWRVLDRQAGQCRGQNAEGGLFLLADQEQVAAALPAEGGRGWILDRHRFSQPGLEGLGPRTGRRLDQVVERHILANLGRGVAFKHDHRPQHAAVALVVQLTDAVQIFLAPRLGQPDHLEGVVAFDQAIGVVVDRLAGTGQQARRRIVVAQDQMAVRLAALQGDAHGHLVDGAARQRISAAQGL